MRRRKRRNPAVAGLVIGTAVLAALGVGVAALVASRKAAGGVLIAPDGTEFAGEPEFTTGMATAEGIFVGDCVVAVQGQAGFTLPGSVPLGDNMLLRVIASGGKNARAVQAVPNDQRISSSAAVIVPTAALAGSGEC